MKVCLKFTLATFLLCFLCNSVRLFATQPTFQDSIQELRVKHGMNPKVSRNGIKAGEVFFNTELITVPPDFFESDYHKTMFWLNTKHYDFEKAASWVEGHGQARRIFDDFWAAIKTPHGIFESKHDEKMFWLNAGKNNWISAKTWAINKEEARRLFNLLWSTDTIDVKVVDDFDYYYLPHDNYRASNESASGRRSDEPTPKPTTTVTKLAPKPIRKVFQKAPSANLSEDYYYSYPSSDFHEVRGYTKKDGTYVPPHFRTNPNSTMRDNWSSSGNFNPFTGKKGYVTPKY